MTVLVSDAFFSNPGDGVTTAFGYPAPLLAKGDVIVELIEISTGLVTPQALDTHYTVALAADLQSATITMLVSPPATHAVVRRRAIDYRQPVELRTHGPFFAKDVEQALDRLVMMMQAIRDTSSRTLRFSDSEPPNLGGGFALPSPAVRRGKQLLFANTPEALPVVGDLLNPGSLVVSAYVQSSVLPLANTTAAQVEFTAPAMVCGRLTLVSGQPRMTSNQAAVAVVRFTNYRGRVVPIWNGTIFQMQQFVELSNDLTQSAAGKAGPAVAAANRNYDLFTWSDLGTPRLTRGPDWNAGAVAGSDVARGTGAGSTELTTVHGIPVNARDIVNGPLAGFGTYVGTIRTDAAAKVNWVKGGIGVGGSAAILGVWNAYNRFRESCFIGDSTDNWNYFSITWRPANNSTAMRVSFVQGLQLDQAVAEYGVLYFSPGGFAGYCGVGLDSTTAVSGRPGTGSGTGGNGQTFVARHAVDALGFHFVQALERSNSVDGTFYGDAGFPASVQNALTFEGWF